MISSIILIGGKGTRLGRCKSSEYLCGKSLIEHVIERLKPVSDQFILVASENQQINLSSNKIVTINDLYPESGPLGGIYTGLVHSVSTYNFVAACDMPFINISLLKYMLKLKDGYDAVVPRIEERKIEPLHAIYSRDSLDIMKEQLDLGRLKVHEALLRLNVRYIDHSELMQFGPQLLSFFNINSKQDLARASCIIKGNKQYLQHT